MHTLSSTTVLADSPCPLTSTTVNTLALPPPLFAMKATVANLPTELLPDIFEFAACCNKPNPTGESSRYTLQLVSRAVRKWTHPLLYGQLRIFSIARMVAFVEKFDTSRAECMALLVQNVRDLSLLELDDRRSYGQPFFLGADRVIDVNAYLVRMFELCKGLKRISVNYIQEGLNMVDSGARPQELTVRRGLEGMDKVLTSILFENVTKLHFRFEELGLHILQKLPLHRLTHFGFTHHFRSPDDSCVELVSKLLEYKNIQRVLVEVGYQWQVDPSVRKTLANEWPQEDRLMVRFSRYELCPYEENVFKDGEDVWDVSRDLEWRVTDWDLEE